jgi:hypothetical protein
VLNSPTGAPGLLQWSGVPIAAAEKLLAVTCTGTRCLTISSGNGTAQAKTRTFRSTDGGATWTGGDVLPAAPDAGGGTTQAGSDVACDPAGTCVIAGPIGGVWRSTDDGQHWQGLKQPSEEGLSYTRLACPEADLCVLVGTAEGSLILNGTKGTPVDVPLQKTSFATAIACDSTARCTAADNVAHVMSISKPWDRWGKLEVLPGKKTDATTLGSLSCSGANACVGIASFPPGRALVGSPGSWKRVNTGSGNLIAVGCAAGSSSCAAVGGGGAWFTSANSGVNWAPVNNVPPLKVLDCSAKAPPGTCVGAGKEAIGKTTTAGELWTTPYPGLTSLDAAAVSCLQYPDCLVIGKSKVLGTPDGGDTWNFRFGAGDVTGGPGGGTCPLAGTCYGVGSGSVFTTFDAARSQWQAGPIPTAPAETLSGMSCPRPDLCVVAGSETIYRGTLAISDGRAHWSWNATDAEPDDAFKAISCSSASSCSAVSASEAGQGQVETTTDPALLHWESHTIKNTIDPGDPTEFQAVSCPADNVCVAGALRGFVATTTDNWATYSFEQFAAPVNDAETAPDIVGVSCSSPARCLLLGDKDSPPAPANGAVYIGTR